jgi:hypothetical protein
MQAPRRFRLTRKVVVLEPCKLHPQTLQETRAAAMRAMAADVLKLLQDATPVIIQHAPETAAESFAQALALLQRMVMPDDGAGTGQLATAKRKLTTNSSRGRPAYSLARLYTNLRFARMLRNSNKMKLAIAMAAQVSPGKDSSGDIEHLRQILSAADDNVDGPSGPTLSRARCRVDIAVMLVNAQRLRQLGLSSHRVWLCLSEDASPQHREWFVVLEYSADRPGH